MCGSTRCSSFLGGFLNIFRTSGKGDKAPALAYPRDMALRVAVQMDPLEKINIAGDSTFALTLKAQERGHKLYHYLAEDLTYQDDRLYAGAREVSVQAVAGDHFRI